MLGTCEAIGDIDLATAPALAANLRETTDGSDEVIVSVDCSGVTFMDSAGFHVLVTATEYAARRGHTLVIRNASPWCARTIQLCDYDGELRVEIATQRRRASAGDSARLFARGA
jgi:anti-anti-sigma factor